MSRPLVVRRVFLSGMIMFFISTVIACREEEPLPPHVVAQIDSGQQNNATAPVATRVPPLVNSVPDWRINGSLPVYEKWDMQETAARSLGRIGSAAVPELILALQDPNPLLRRQAATVLARIGPEARTAVPALTALLNDPDEQVRKSAAYALGQIGPAAAEAVPVLMEVIRAHADEQQYSPPSQPVGSAGKPPRE